MALISQASKVMLKILQASFQQYLTVNFQMFKLHLEKAEDADIKLSASFGLSKKQEGSKKKNNMYFCFIDYCNSQDIWLCGSQRTVESS